MAKCFLSYSSSYEHLKEPFRRLLEALGFEKPVEVFDGPEMDAIPEVVIQKNPEGRRRGGPLWAST